MYKSYFLAFLVGSISCGNALADDLFAQCLQQSVLTADDSVTVAQLRENCAGFVSENSRESSASVNKSKTYIGTDMIETAEPESLKTSTKTAFVLQHKDNYMLPISYYERRSAEEFSDEQGELLDNKEIKFQFSLKTRIINNLLKSGGQLYVAYTNQSYWQAYNGAISRPFRETNHQPELFLDYSLDYSWLGWRFSLLRFGLEHQSNGRSEPLSRSWNRFYTQFQFESDRSMISFQPWWRIPESEEQDDNPDIEDFMGKFELNGLHELGKHQVQWLLRNNLKSDNKGALRLEWSYPVYEGNQVRLYLQYFDGYGESLIDYDRRSRRIGLGFKLNR